MKKIRLDLTFIILATIGIFSSCHKDEILEDDQNVSSDQHIRLENGILKFDSESNLEATIQNLMNNQNSLDEWEKQFSGFISMRTAYNNLSEKDMINIALQGTNKGFEDILTLTGTVGEQEVRMNIDDDVLATIANKKGLIQIKNYVYKISYNTLYKVHKKNINNLNLQKLSTTHEIETYPIIHNYYNVASSENDEFQKADRTCSKRYSKKKRKRLRGEQWTTHIGSIYSGAGARTKHQKRFAGLWFRNKTDQLRLRLNGTFIQYLDSGGVFIEDVNKDSGWKNDNGKEAYLFDFCVNLNCTFEIRDLTSIHECICDDDKYRICEIVF